MRLWCAKVNDYSYFVDTMVERYVVLICNSHSVELSLNLPFMYAKWKAVVYWLYLVYFIFTPDTSTPRSTCSDGEVRLVGGTTEYEGRVEVCVSNTWGTVCAGRYYYYSYGWWWSRSQTTRYHWDIADGKVVCRQLGHQELGTVRL